MEAFMPTKDGHIGNLETKSLRELKDLLARHEKLLKKGAFINTLPDKGEKSKRLVESIKELIQKRTENDPIFKSESDVHNIRQSLFQTQYSSEVKQTVKSDPESMLEGSSERVSKFKLERMQAKSSERTQNIVTEKIETGDVHLKTKTVKDAEDDGMDTAFQGMSLKDDGSGDHVTHTPSKQHPESAATPPVYKYNKVKPISLQESINLQQEQKQKQEELQAELSVERLAQRLHIKMEAFNPEGADMSYRSRGGNQDEVSDSDDEPEVDY